jgi:hypothetical protein
MNIVVGGYIVGFPLGGMTWHHLNYLIGLVELGHEVTFMEDGGYLPPFDPSTGLTGDPAYGLRYLRETFEAYGLRIPWFYRFGKDGVHGMSVGEIEARLKSADLFIAVSGVTPVEWYPMPKRTLVIDTDPVFTQLRMIGDPAFLGYYKSFTHAATFGTLIGRGDCPLPTHGIDWIPTCQPIALSRWPAEEARSRAFTTIGKWEHAADRTLSFAGKTYRSSKGVEWMKMVDLPGRVPWEMTLGMQAMPADVQAAFRARGWTIVDPEAATRSCRAYQDFIASSAGEFTVAKEIYTGLKSGWFSDRSACYLATGRPVVTQASGFERWLPTGEGLLSFETPDEAADALRAIDRDYPRHARAARRIAENYFDANMVLRDLLGRVV